MIEGVDHIGIVVKSLDEALDLYVNTLGFKKSEMLTVEGPGKFRSVMVSLDALTIELMEPVDTQGSIHKFLQTKGEGIHHVSILVDDIKKELNLLDSKGIRLINKEPEYVKGSLVSFIHPASMKGVLIELLQKI
jgi:methylmalonyl-CoA/ethylmalonyl-CoA epimerase